MAEPWKVTRTKLFALSVFDALGQRLVAPFLEHRASLPEPLAVRRVLVTELWNMGDVLLASPFLAQLRRVFPNAQITLLAKAHARELLGPSGLVDEFFAFDFPWTSSRGKYRIPRYDLRALRKLFHDLRRREFDVSFDCRMDARGNVVTYLAGAGVRVGYRFGGAHWLLTHALPLRDRSAHKSSDWMQLLTPFTGVSPDVELVHLVVAKNERTEAGRFLEAHGVRHGDIVVGVHPGASRPEKTWPLSRFEQIGRELTSVPRVRVLVFADPAGYGSTLANIPGVIVVQPSVQRLPALIERCKALVCNDSGPMHIAAALGVPVVAVFGSGKAEWFSPLGENHRVLTLPELRCRPCYGACRFSEPFCLTRIPVTAVREAVNKVLASVGAVAA